MFQNLLNKLNCVDTLFKSADYHNNYISKKELSEHNYEDNVWLSIDNNVYSIRKDDKYLLEIFKNYYGKDIKKYLFEELNIDNNEKINILNKLKERHIGKLTSLD